MIIYLIQIRVLAKVRLLISWTMCKPIKINPSIRDKTLLSTTSPALSVASLSTTRSSCIDKERSDIVVSVVDDNTANCFLVPVPIQTVPTTSTKRSLSKSEFFDLATEESFRWTSPLSCLFLYACSPDDLKRIIFQLRNRVHHFRNRVEFLEIIQLESWNWNAATRKWNARKRN